MDLGSPGGPFSESAGWTLVTVEHFEKFKMASKVHKPGHNFFHIQPRMTILVSRHRFYGSGSGNP